MSLTFKTSDLVRCIDHALKSTNWSMGYETDIQPKPALLLVHDNGVYIMSNGNPGDFIQEKERCYVAYAENCHPDNDEDFYENSRELVGGDDFVEVIPIDERWTDMISKFKELQIDISPEDLNIFFTVPC